MAVAETAHSKVCVVVMVVVEPDHHTPSTSAAHDDIELTGVIRMRMGHRQ